MGTSRHQMTRWPSASTVVLDQLLELGAALVLGRQEADADGVASGGRQVDAGGDAAEEGVGDLQQDAGAVTGVRVRAGGAAVLEVAERLEALLDDGMRRLPPQLGDQRDAARVVFVVRVVEAAGPPCGGCLIHKRWGARVAGGSCGREMLEDRPGASA